MGVKGLWRGVPAVVCLLSIKSPHLPSSLCAEALLRPSPQRGISKEQLLCMSAISSCCHQHTHPSTPPPPLHRCSLSNPSSNPPSTLTGSPIHPNPPPSQSNPPCINMHMNLFLLVLNSNDKVGKHALEIFMILCSN